MQHIGPRPKPRCASLASSVYPAVYALVLVLVLGASAAPVGSTRSMKACTVTAADGLQEEKNQSFITINAKYGKTKAKHRL